MSVRVLVPKWTIDCRGPITVTLPLFKPLFLICRGNEVVQPRFVQVLSEGGGQDRPRLLGRNTILVDSVESVSEFDGTQFQQVKETFLARQFVHAAFKLKRPLRGDRGEHDG